MKLFLTKYSLKPRHKVLLRMIGAQWRRLSAAMGCMMIIALCTSATAFLIKPVLDDIFFQKNAQMLKLIPLVVILIYVIRGIANFGQEYLMTYVGETVIRQLRDRLYDRIQDLPVGFFQEQKTGVLMSRVTNDVNVIKEMASTAVTSILRDAFTVLGLACVIFYRDWKLAILALIILPVAFYPVVEFGKRVRKVSTGCQEAMADISTFLHETFFGNKIVKAFGMESYEKKRFSEKTQRLFRLEIRSAIAKSLSTPVMELLAGLGIAFVIWYGGSRVIAGTSTPGTFFSFMAAVLMLYDPVRKMTKLNNAIQQGLAATDRIFDILERESDIIEPSNPITIELKPHQVTFDQVWLQYDSTMVLKNINLTVQPGEILAIVGMSGGGKTSLVNLIPRFYDPTKGRILFDNIDIRSASLVSLRRQIAMVTQDTILFNDTIRNNIAYGKPNATVDEIERAAKAAYAYDFIINFPKGFDTLIGELGNRLSGGEKQRICIARAILKDAPVLILDEATSSLDTEAEMVVQKALENLMKGRTTFVIAHRLSTIAFADRIIVLVNGEIVEQGKHDELLKLNGEYFKLYQMQFSDKSSLQDGPKVHP